MKSLLLKLTIFVILTGGTIAAFYWRFELNFNDRFYHKFTYHPQSLIAGSSRALLGLDPESIQEACPDGGKLLNFAFTMKTSPYGEVYYNAICKKIGSDVKGGIFILEVSPMSIAASKEQHPEKDMVLGRISFFNTDPNIDYVARNNEHPFYFDMLPYEGKAPLQQPHASGWLENLTAKRDSASYAKKINEQTTEYTEIFKAYTISQYRREWLAKTIDMLSQHGQVILLHMPVSDKMTGMESKYCPGFTTMMQELAKKKNIVYLDLPANENYVFDDLHHMSSQSAKQFSKAVGDTICSLRKR